MSYENEINSMFLNLFKKKINLLFSHYNSIKFNQINFRISRISEKLEIMIYEKCKLLFQIFFNY